jgi:hypothetical protein
MPLTYITGTSGTGSVGITLQTRAGENKCIVLIGRYAVASLDGTSATPFLSTTKWRVRKIAGGAAVGFPVSARNVIGDTSGTEVPAGYIGESVDGTGISVGSMTSGTYYTVATITLNKGVYLVVGQVYANPTTGISFSGIAEVMTSAGTPNATRLGCVRAYASGGGYLSAQGTNTFVISADSTTLYLRMAVFHSGTVNGGVASQQHIRAIRIA